uniref:Uncharacterized protein n=1 Tax=Anguilla anguilla TaxID=7936 RepID=A0A0E9SYC3_ANGAN
MMKLIPGLRILLSCRNSSTGF